MCECTNQKLVLEPYRVDKSIITCQSVQISPLITALVSTIESEFDERIVISWIVIILIHYIVLEIEDTRVGLHAQVMADITSLIVIAVQIADVYLVGVFLDKLIPFRLNPSRMLASLNECKDEQWLIWMMHLSFHHINSFCIESTKLKLCAQIINVFVHFSEFHNLSIHL